MTRWLEARPRVRGRVLRRRDGAGEALSALLLTPRTSSCRSTARAHARRRAAAAGRLVDRRDAADSTASRRSSEPVFVKRRGRSGAIDGTGSPTSPSISRTYRIQIDPTTGPRRAPGRRATCRSSTSPSPPTSRPPGTWSSGGRTRRAARSPASARARGRLDQRRTPTTRRRSGSRRCALTFKLEVEQYVATSQEVYAITLPADSSRRRRAPGASCSARGPRRDRGRARAEHRRHRRAVDGRSSNGDVVACAAHLSRAAHDDGERRPAPRAAREPRSAWSSGTAPTLGRVDGRAHEPGGRRALPRRERRRGARRGRAHRPARLPRRGERARHGGPDTQLEADIYLGSRHPRSRAPTGSTCARAS
jgi:hypothetical protein